MSSIADGTNAESGRASVRGEGDLRPGDRALRDSEDRFRRLFEMSLDAIYIQSGGKLALINRAGAKLLGAETPENLVGRCVRDLVHPDWRERIKEQMGRLLEEQTEIPLIQGKYLRLDGNSVDVEMIATPCAYGDRPGALLLARDITGQRLAR